MIRTKINPDVEKALAVKEITGLTKETFSNMHPDDNVKILIKRLIDDISEELVKSSDPEELAKSLKKTTDLRKYIEKLSIRNSKIYNEKIAESFGKLKDIKFSRTKIEKITGLGMEKKAQKANLVGVKNEEISSIGGPPGIDSRTAPQIVDKVPAPIIKSDKVPDIKPEIQSRITGAGGIKEEVISPVVSPQDSFLAKIPISEKAAKFIVKLLQKQPLSEDDKKLSDDDVVSIITGTGLTSDIINKLLTGKLSVDNVRWFLQPILKRISVKEYFKSFAVSGKKDEPIAESIKIKAPEGQVIDIEKQPDISSAESQETISEFITRNKEKIAGGVSTVAPIAGLSVLNQFGQNPLAGEIHRILSKYGSIPMQIIIGKQLSDIFLSDKFLKGFVTYGKYCGPGTDTFGNLRKGIKPISLLDQNCAFHDIAYDSNNPYIRSKADENFLLDMPIYMFDPILIITSNLMRALIGGLMSYNLLQAKIRDSKITDKDEKDMFNILELQAVTKEYFSDKLSLSKYENYLNRYDESKSKDITVIENPSNNQIDNMASLFGVSSDTMESIIKSKKLSPLVTDKFIQENSKDESISEFEQVPEKKKTEEERNRERRSKVFNQLTQKNLLGISHKLLLKIQEKNKDIGDIAGDIKDIMTLDDPTVIINSRPIKIVDIALSRIRNEQQKLRTQLSSPSESDPEANTVFRNLKVAEVLLEKYKKGEELEAPPQIVPTGERIASEDISQEDIIELMKQVIGEDQMKTQQPLLGLPAPEIDQSSELEKIIRKEKVTLQDVKETAAPDKPGKSHLRPHQALPAPSILSQSYFANQSNYDSIALQGYVEPYSEGPNGTLRNNIMKRTQYKNDLLRFRTSKIIHFPVGSPLQFPTENNLKKYSKLTSTSKLPNISRLYKDTQILPISPNQRWNGLTNPYRKMQNAFPTDIEVRKSNLYGRQP